MYQLYSHRPQSANLVMFYHVVPCRVHPHRAQFHAPTAWDRSDVPKTEDIYKSVQIKSRKFQKMDEHGTPWYKIGMDLCSSFFIYALNVFFHVFPIYYAEYTTGMTPPYATKKPRWTQRNDRIQQGPKKLPSLNQLWFSGLMWIICGYQYGLKLINMDNINPH